MSDEIITSELSPFAYCLKYENKKIYCDCCFKKITRVCSCPVCELMYYCDRKCENNDTTHKFECEHFKRAAKVFELNEMLKDDLIRLFLRIMIRINNTNDIDATYFFDLQKSHQKIYDIMAKKYTSEISKLMGKDFISSINFEATVTSFDKMMTNKIEIKNDQETLGFGIYLQNFFDDLGSEKNEVYFDGIKLFYKRKLFPALRFSESATKDPNVRVSIRIANKFLESGKVRYFYHEKIKVKADILRKKIFDVKIIFVDQEKANPNAKDLLAWTDRYVINEIYINRIFEKRLNAISCIEDDSAQKEKETITVFIGFLLIHEFAHLLYRWNGNFYSPENKDAGFQLENVIFDGRVRPIISPKSQWNENSKYLGIGIRIRSSKKRKMQFFSYENYIKKLYEDNLNFSSYFTPKLEEIEFNNDILALRQCDCDFEQDPDDDNNSDWDDYEAIYNIKICGT
ncbi:unnamed protein product [Brachionus calyciflorus]|uniref:MYND-type domain-containing protein n=1 Tax=Brachionus calyciflorus TaxID=104777 RepID=A0A814EQQ9_9BILA|nr:unnamed protein product [Brachionus calyciflorus]